MNMKLNKLQWFILDTLVNGSEPLEQVYLDLQYDSLVSSPDVLLPEILQLSKMDFVTLRQESLGESAGQSFENRDIQPNAVEQVLGDLQEQYHRFKAKGDYVKCFCDSGIPFGVYLKMSDSGRAERDRPEYESYLND